MCGYRPGDHFSGVAGRSAHLLGFRCHMMLVSGSLIAPTRWNKIRFVGPLAEYNTAIERE